MRTYKCASLVACCILILVFSLLILSWILLIFLLPILFLLFAGAISFYGEDINIEVKRNLSNIKIFEHDKIVVTLKIKNLGGKISYLELHDTLPGKIEILNGSNYAVLNLKKNEEVEIKYEISCPIRGFFPIGPLFFRVHDFFGMFYKEAVVKTSTTLTVIPPIEELRDIAVRAKPNIYPGIMLANHSGIGTEFFGIRKYASGDTFKRINWKSYARYNTLMVNEYELESTTDVIIILDARYIESIGTIKHNPLEYSIKAAVSLTSHFLKRRDRVGIITYGSPDGHLKWVYPESGKKQLFKIIEELVSIQANGEFPFSGAVYQSVTHLLPKRALVFYISSLENDYTISKGIEELTARNFNLIILSPSPIDIEYSLQKPDEYQDLAYRILKFERTNFLNQLRNSGARVVDWNPSIPLIASLKEVERYQVRR